MAKTGNEQFTLGGKPIGFSVLDFWRFSYSELNSDPRDDIAEYLVSMALGEMKPYNKRDWTLYDIEYRNSRIEVKSTSYYQTWRADGKINPHRSFSIRKSTDASGVKCHHSDVYVFCLLDGKTEEAANPLVLENWFFYVVPTKHIDEVCGDNKTISLTKIKSLGYSSLSYSQLREAIDSALERRQ